TVLNADLGYGRNRMTVPLSNSNISFPVRVNGHLCILQRQELNLKGKCICEGYFMDSIMSM
ncbi:MAG TPA: hypothetical protein VJ508_05430, partial [Saprospiraceae bacterium]|nr:hypothetical protein [Saprospiraceae bacterium]